MNRNFSLNDSARFFLSGMCFILRLHYIQTKDIDLGNKTFTPISTVVGDYRYTNFVGNYNGNFKSVKGLYVNKLTSYNGLFGRVHGGTIKNLSVYGKIDSSDIQHQGSGSGGIVGELGTTGQVINCSFNGTVKGAWGTGGIVGNFWCGGIVNGCYFNGTVDCIDWSCGGIVGIIRNGTKEDSFTIGNFEVCNCYAVGEIISNHENSRGIIGTTIMYGEGNTQKYSNNYYLDTMVTDNTNIMEGCQSMDSDFMKNIDELLGKPFVHNDSSELNDGYPVFEWQSIPYQFKGSGTADDPYQISSKEELEKMRDLVNSPFFGENQYNTKYYIQTADIDLKNEQWIPIGKDMKDGVQGGLPPFRGHYNGNHHFIKNLYVNENDKFAGLFGSLNSGGVIENLEVYGNVKSTGNSVGGVLGELGSANGVVRNCCFFGNVESSGDAVGGVVGYLWVCGTIENCYHNGSVTNTADEPVGGIVGHIYSGRHESYNAYVKNCYHVGKVSGRDAVTGSILGFSEEYDDTEGKTSISNCYSIKGDAPANGNGSYTATDMNELSENMLKNNAVSKLGSPFIKNSNNDFNSGYPVFWWQLSGDTNFDGKLSVTDVVAVQKWLHKQGSLSEWQNVDFNGDGKVNVVDLCLMKKKLLGK